MPRSMANADYVYTPHSAERRARQSAAALARLGIPEGFRRVYGIHVPEAVAPALRGYAAFIASRHGADKARSIIMEAEARDWFFERPELPARPSRKVDWKFLYACMAETSSAEELAEYFGVPEVWLARHLRAHKRLRRRGLRVWELRE